MTRPTGRSPSLAAAVLLPLTGCSLIALEESTYLYGTELDRPGEHVLLWSEAGNPHALRTYSWRDDGETVSGGEEVGTWLLFGAERDVPAELSGRIDVAIVLLPKGAGPVEQSLGQAALSRLRALNPALSSHVVVGAAPPPGTDDALELDDWLGATRRERYGDRQHTFLHGLGEAVLKGVAEREQATRVVAPLSDAAGSYAIAIRGEQDLPEELREQLAARILSAGELAAALSGRLPVLLLLPVGTPEARRRELLDALAALPEDRAPGRVGIVSGAGVCFEDVADLEAFQTLALHARR